MASYPGAVKTFVSRNAGDVIQPAHVNDLQDEVNAIEAGLLNGTAPLNSSNSTLANLSVSGNSTITGALTVATLSVTSASSFGGALIAPNSTTPTLSTGNVNDFVVSSNAFFVGLNPGAGGSTITGISAGQVHGRILALTNVSANTVDLANNNAGSSVANRFAVTTGANISLASGQGFLLYYSTNGGVAFWRALGR